MDVHGTVNRGDMFQLHDSISLEQLLEWLHSSESLVAHALPHHSRGLIDRRALHSVESSVLLVA